MTNPTPPGQVPDALRLADQYAAAHAKWELEDLHGSIKSYTAEKLAERHAARAKLERALHAAHVQNPAEIEHVAGDVSKNEAEVNTSTQQTAPATQQAVEGGDAEDAARWHWLAEYLVGTRTDLDDGIIASATVDELRKLVDADLATIKQGEKQ